MWEKSISIGTFSGGRREHTNAPPVYLRHDLHPELFAPE